MRKRFQTGNVKTKDGRYWVGQWWEDGENGKRHRRNKILGKIKKMTITEARAKLADILQTINNAAKAEVPQSITLEDFATTVFFPFYKRKWKPLSYKSRTVSIQHYIVGTFGSRRLDEITRDDMQLFLDGLKDLAYTTVDHLRWDLKQLMDLAVAERVIPSNPVYVPPATMLLFVPRECKKPERRVLTIEQAKLIFAALDLRERCIVKLGIIAGMRCSEIFGLKRGSVEAGHVQIVERVCRRDIDTPKTEKSRRLAALAPGLQEDLKLWLDRSNHTGPDQWLFPSEALTPMDADNVMERNIKPKLKAIGLDWVDFRVFRRTHASLMKDMKVDPKLVADQQGHTVDVNQNTYTQTSIESRIEAVQVLESAMMN